MLINYKLYYEESDRMNRTSINRSKVRGIFNNVIKNTKHIRQNKTLSTGTTKKTNKGLPNHVILGIGLLLVVVSIAYSTSVIFIGVDSLASRIALLPQVIFAFGILVFAFSKIFRKGA